jgi:hypothetical protein
VAGNRKGDSVCSGCSAQAGGAPAERSQSRRTAHKCSPTRPSRPRPAALHQIGEAAALAPILGMVEHGRDCRKGNAEKHKLRLHNFAVFAR